MCVREFFITLRFFFSFFHSATTTKLLRVSVLLSAETASTQPSRPLDRGRCRIARCSSFTWELGDLGTVCCLLTPFFSLRNLVTSGSSVWLVGSASMYSKNLTLTDWPGVGKGREDTWITLTHKPSRGWWNVEKKRNNSSGLSGAAACAVANRKKNLKQTSCETSFSKVGIGAGIWTRGKRKAGAYKWWAIQSRPTDEWYWATGAYWRAGWKMVGIC